MDIEFGQHRSVLFQIAEGKRPPTQACTSSPFDEEPGTSLLRMKARMKIKIALREWDKCPPPPTIEGVEDACKTLWQVSWYYDSETGERYE